MKRKLYLTILLTSLCLLFVACGVKKVDYTSFERTTSQKDMAQTIGSEPNETKKTEDGGITYTYKKSVYDRYTGSMSYQYYDDMLYYSKWTHIEKKEKKAEKVYENICTALKKQYGNGSEDKTNHTTTFEEENKYIIAAHALQDQKYAVCITEMMK